MSYIDNLKLSEEFVQQYIKPNGSNAITAQVLQNVLMNIIEAAEDDITNAAGGLQRYIDLFLAGTSNIADAAVTTPKIADAAVTTQKIDNLAVTLDKLAPDTQRYILTEDMREWIIEKMGEDRQEEAQELFSGETFNSGLTEFVYGEYSVANMRKDVVVQLSFNGIPVLADEQPVGWILDGMSYRYCLSVDGNHNVPSTMFTYTVAEGEFKGYKVKYNSRPGSVARVNPIYYGFVPTNDECNLNSALIGSLNYSTEDVIMRSAKLENPLAMSAYLCIITMGTAEATQMGISCIGEPKDVPAFVSPRSTSVTMTGYSAYFSKNPVAEGGSLGNVNLTIIR